MLIKLPNGKEVDSESPEAKEAANPLDTTNKETLVVEGAPTKEELEYYKDLAARQAQLLQNVVNKVERIETKVEESNRPAPPVVDRKALNDRFWSDPTAVLGEMIERQIEPLTKFASDFKGVSELDKIKQELSNDPTFGVILKNPSAVGVVDQLMNGQKVSRDSVKAAVLAATGMIALGQIPGVTLDGTNNTTNTGGGTRNDPNPNLKPSQGTNIVLPPHLRPSAPAAPRGNDGTNNPSLRPLSEQEERLRRENNLTHADYLALVDLKPHEVATSRIGLPSQGAK